MSDTQDRFFGLVTEHLCLDPDRLGVTDAGQLKLASDLGADSLDFVELTMAAEDAFAISIEDDEADKLVENDGPLAAWVELIDSKLAPAIAA